MPDVEVVEEKCMNSEKSFRGHTDLNHGPIGLQPIALPLSYTSASLTGRQVVLQPQLAMYDAAAYSCRAALV